MELSDEQLEELKKAFEANDTNSDGLINKIELTNFLKGLGEYKEDKEDETAIKVPGEPKENKDDGIVNEMMILADTDEDG